MELWLNRSSFQRGRGGEIGRRARLRIWSRKGYRFESVPRHKHKLREDSRSLGNDPIFRRSRGIVALKIGWLGGAGRALAFRVRKATLSAGVPDKFGPAYRLVKTKPPMTPTDVKAMTAAWREFHNSVPLAIQVGKTLSEAIVAMTERKTAYHAFWETYFQNYGYDHLSPKAVDP
jgi:hypothetical protein